MASRTAIEETREFLEPLLSTKSGPSNVASTAILEILALRVPDEFTSICPFSTHVAIYNAIRLMKRLSREQGEDRESFTAPADRVLVYGLLDLVTLETIYPALSPGVGVPIERRVKPVFLRRKDQPVRGNKEQLEFVISGLVEAWKAGGKLRDLISRRCLVDIVAGGGELALSPEAAESTKSRWIVEWGKFLKEVPTGPLLSTLLMLLHPKTPRWFRQYLSFILSRVPVEREHGVRSILELFLGAPSDDSRSAASLQALAKAAQLLGSVPSQMEPLEYFESVGKQLIELLHAPDQGLVRASAYVLAEFLNKRGALEEAVEKTVVNKILQSFRPVVREATPKVKKKPLIAIIDEEEEEKGPSNDGAIVSEMELSKAIHGIALILTSNPSPLVPQKLIKPIISSLWALYIYSKAGKKGGDWGTTTRSLLLGWLRDSSGLKTAEEPGTATLLRYITFSGGAGWEFASGSDGGIEIRRREEQPLFSVDNINLRVQEFISILKDLSEEHIAEVFIFAFREWVRDVSSGKNAEAEANPERMLASLQLLQILLSEHTDSLAKKLSDTLQLVKEVLDGYVTSQEASQRENSFIGTPSILSLGNIVKEETPDLFTTEYEDESVDEETAIESGIENVVVLSLTLLSALISSPETKITESDQRLLDSLQPTLKIISQQEEPAALSSLAFNILSIISTSTSSTDGTQPTDAASKDRESYKTALTYLTDPLVPVRAHGLSVLRDLILAKSPVIDVQNTIRLLVSMLADVDSYVYLNVVKTLQALGDKHSRRVISSLIDVYIDEPQKLSLDERLRVGEAIMGIIQKLGEAFVEESARLVGESMIGLVSRRKRRTDDRPKKHEKPHRPTKPGNEDEMEVEFPEMDEEGNELTARQLEELEHNRRIIEKWKPGGAEDYRLRASALSILSVAIETNPRGLTVRVVDETVEAGLAIMQLEREPEAGILRRAAVVVLVEMVKSGRVETRLRDIRRVVGWAGLQDNDGLVREMCGDVERLIDDRAGVVLPQPAGLGASTVEGVGGIERLALR